MEWDKNMLFFFDVMVFKKEDWIIMDVFYKIMDIK